MQSEADAWKVVLDALTGLYATGSTCANKSGQGYATSYDVFGNVSSRTYNNTTATLSYDTQDHLAEWNAGASSQEWYLYDAKGQRVLRRSTNSSGTTLTVYAFGLEEHVYSGSGSNQGNTYYYTLAGQLLGKSDGQSSTFYQTDLLGSVVADWSTTAGSASLLGNEVYGPYGKERYNQGTHGTSIGFTGQYGDWVSGLDYYNARYYDPKAGCSSRLIRCRAMGPGWTPIAMWAAIRRPTPTRQVKDLFPHKSHHLLQSHHLLRQSYLQKYCLSWAPG